MGWPHGLPATDRQLRKNCAVSHSVWAKHCPWGWNENNAALREPCLPWLHPRHLPFLLISWGSHGLGPHHSVHRLGVTTSLGLREGASQRPRPTPHASPRWLVWLCCVPPGSPRDGIGGAGGDFGDTTGSSPGFGGNVGNSCKCGHRYTVRYVFTSQRLSG